LVAEICAGCGGGAASVVQQPQAADFSVAVSSPAVSILQGGVSAPVNFSIIAQNGFSGSVQVTFAGLSAGVSCNPVSPFTITTGIDTSVNFGASATAETGSFTLSAQAVSGTLSHSASLTLAIQPSTVAALPARISFEPIPREWRILLRAKGIVATSCTMRLRCVSFSNGFVGESARC